MRITVKIKHEPQDVFIYFDKDPDGSGYTGWFNYQDDEKTIVRHTINIRQTVPIGKIWFEFDTVSTAGCWQSGQFEGVTITERDLQWCAHWALQAVKYKNAALREL